ncbi:MAG TPA: phosphatidylglycerol lysyltransferase domain-containing protein [Candidatus Sulfotelmatobacter sp.]|nr:phosphatidylglycerol lysyltransferase domain-containing protein [Candidatus Sulfotelmatobacter sp.]
MIPHYPEIKPLEIADRFWINKHLRATSREICELTLGNIFIWQDFYRPKITCLNKNVCIKLEPPTEKRFWLEPLGHNQVEETIETLLQANNHGLLVSASYAARLPADRYRLTPLRDEFDYLYLRSELAELKGRKYDGKRNHLKRFRNAHPDYEFRPLVRADQTAALELFEIWFAARKETKYFKKLAYTAQKNALLAAFANWQELHLFGGAIYINNEMESFTLGSYLNPESVSVHFLYTNPALAGIFQATLWEACHKTFADYKYIDLEQDLGIPGLRTAKLSYHPYKLVEKFEVEKL